MINLIRGFERRQLGYGHLLTSIVASHLFNLLMPLSGVRFLQTADVQFIKALLSSLNHHFVGKWLPMATESVV